MTTIWKFPIYVTNVQDVDMPDGAEILSADFQSAQLCLWALVDTEAALVPRRIEIYGTGHEIKDKRSDGFRRVYVDTVLTAGGSIVWHIFQLP